MAATNPISSTPEPRQQKITTFLWFDNNAEEAANFYTSIFKNSRITETTHYSDLGPGPKGTVMTVGFELDGQLFAALNGGPHFKFNEAISLVIHCKDQEEVDYYWERLTQGGQESQCGWLKDKFGLSWQVVPDVMLRLLKDPEKGPRAMQAMFAMKKFDIRTIEEAAAG